MPRLLRTLATWNLTKLLHLGLKCYIELKLINNRDREQNEKKKFDYLHI